MLVEYSRPEKAAYCQAWMPRTGNNAVANRIIKRPESLVMQNAAQNHQNAKNGKGNAG
jgi:hypothetical protein